MDGRGSTERLGAEWDVAVARLVQAAADAEAGLAQVLRILARVDGPEAGYLLPRDVPAMVEVVRDLLPLHVGDQRLLDDVLGWTRAVLRLSLLRSAVIHSVWEPRTAGPDASMHPVWSNAAGGAHPMTASDLARSTARLAGMCGAATAELVLRLDKAAPRLAVFTRA